MMVDISNLNCDFKELGAKMDQLGNDMSLKIHVMHEDIFNSMHRI